MDRRGRGLRRGFWFWRVVELCEVGGLVRSLLVYKGWGCLNWVRMIVGEIMLYELWERIVFMF